MSKLGRSSVACRLGVFAFVTNGYLFFYLSRVLSFVLRLLTHAFYLLIDFMDARLRLPHLLYQRERRQRPERAP